MGAKRSDSQNNKVLEVGGTHLLQQKPRGFPSQADLLVTYGLLQSPACVLCDYRKSAALSGLLLHPGL